MKSITILLFSLFSVAIFGQGEQSGFDGKNWEAPYTLPVPDGWTIERFLVPIGFAPQIPYSGIEDIRFPPGWGKASSDAYWSYAFLWYLDGNVKTDFKIIERNLKSYYTGLIAVNGRKIPPEKIVPVVTSFREVRNETGDLNTYSGTIEMLDYMTQKPIVLNCKVHIRYSEEEKKTFLFYELSPQPLSHQIWVSLDRLWLDFKCKKS
jgi:hypothetical protein